MADTLECRLCGIIKTIKHFTDAPQEHDTGVQDEVCNECLQEDTNADKD